MGGGSAQLYYLVVYLQLVLLTPWLFRLLDRPATRVALFAVTPIMVCVRYALSVAGISLSIGAFCGTWIVFYLLGLEWRDRIGPWLRSRGIGARHALIALAACLALQELEGFVWFFAGEYNLATSQLKVTSLLSSVCPCALIVLAGESVRQRLASCRLLVSLGDLSFGIYLSHIMVLKVFYKLFEVIGPISFPSSLVLWLVVLVASAILVALCQRVLPKRALAILGFA